MTFQHGDGFEMSDSCDVSIGAFQLCVTCVCLISPEVIILGGETPSVTALCLFTI